jgi:hypothetical protein
MAYDLAQVQRPQLRPIIATIVGEHGLGKTSLAALFPKPFIIRTEDGITPEHEVDAWPVAESAADVVAQIKALREQDHSYGTVILDSISELDSMVNASIVNAPGEKAKSIVQASGGFGAGLSEAAERHRYIRELFGKLSTEKSVNIIFIAHADSEKVDPPDNDAYSRYTIRMHKKAMSHYSDNVDMVAFVKLKMFTSGGDKESNRAGKASFTGQRIITCYPTPSHISKNRFGIESDLIFEKGINPFLEFIPQLKEA